MPFNAYKQPINTLALLQHADASLWSNHRPRGDGQSQHEQDVGGTQRKHPFVGDQARLGAAAKEAGDADRAGEAAAGELTDTYEICQSIFSLCSVYKFRALTWRSH